MNLIRTDRNFSSLKPKDKIQLLKGFANGQIEEATDPELKLTVLVDNEGHHKLDNTDEVIDLEEWESIENYLKGKYPLSRVAINEVKVDDINDTAGNIAA